MSVAVLERYSTSHFSKNIGIARVICYNYPRHATLALRQASFSRVHSVLQSVYAAIAQLVERIHGKDEVLGSNPSRGSIFMSHPSHNSIFMLELIRLQ